MENTKMSEKQFLETYNSDNFERPSVAVDLVFMSVIDGELVALLGQRDAHPSKGDWALPGGFVGIGESLDDAAQRVAKEKACFGGKSRAWLEQLYSFGDVARDPRMRIITVAYFALIPPEQFTENLAQRADLTLATITLKGETITALGADNTALSLAFDHGDILRHAVSRLRGKLDYSPIAFALLPDLFTLRDLQEVHQAIMGKSLNKPAFRRRMLDSRRVHGTGTRESGTSYRPAELYRFKP